MGWGVTIVFGLGVLAFVLPPPILAVLAARSHGREMIGIGAKLEQIHTLVNSNLSAALQGELDQTRRILILLRRIEAMTSGEPTAEEHSVIEQTKLRIAELETTLADRATQTTIADKEVSG